MKKPSESHSLIVQLANNNKLGSGTGNIPDFNIARFCEDIHRFGKPVYHLKLICGLSMGEYSEAMLSIKNFVLLSLIAFVSGSTFSQELQSDIKSSGPESGHLIIHGGGRLDDSVLDKFIELAGGPEAPVVIIPTASETATSDQRNSTAQRLRNRGVKDVTVVHTTNREEASAEDFLQPIQRAKAIWFGGGRQWRLVDAYAGTKAEIEFRKVLERGGVIGGSSAGATIQGSFLARGDTSNNQIMDGDHVVGFGYLENTAIDQHHLARNRHFDMFTILENHPHLLGIGVDEDTAIIFDDKSVFRVIGNGYVTMYDRSFWSREGSRLKRLPEAETLFYFLRENDLYNIRERKVITRQP